MQNLIITEICIGMILCKLSKNCSNQIARKIISRISNTSETKN